MTLSLTRVPIVLMLAAVGVAHAQWKPITPEEMSAKPGTGDGQADAVAVFRDVRILNEASTFGYRHNVIELSKLALVRATVAVVLPGFNALRLSLNLTTAAQ